MRIKSIAGRVAVNVARLVLGGTFVFSGYVKAVDPLGTQYKMQDYLQALGLAQYVPDWLTLSSAVALAALEFSLGIFMLFAIRRRLVSKLMLCFMVLMTVLTVWIAIANPVKDCGCFGDAVHLSNTATLIKNIILLTCSLIVWYRPLFQYRFISKSNQWIAINFTILFIILTSLHCLYHLPLFDFRPYHVGANIPRGMTIPKGAPQPEFETTFILEKNGVRKEFTLDNYPDSTWTFIDSKTVQIKEGYVPPIHDFSIQKYDGEDITRQVLDYKGYTFLLIAPHLENADDSNFGDIDRIYEYALSQGIPFYCLTASGKDGVSHWQDITGAEYPFCLTDETTLKTIIRSNPGLLLLKDGTVIRKWGHNDLPSEEELNGPLSKIPLGQLPDDTIHVRVVKVVLWFFLPLLLLTLADRLWSWSKYVQGKMDKQKRKIEDIEHKTFVNISTKKKGNNNEKENCSR
jgi:uncharacterized membrane protein YphA (DoxX/SURF4 family)